MHLWHYVMFASTPELNYVMVRPRPTPKMFIFLFYLHRTKKERLNCTIFSGTLAPSILSTRNFSCNWRQPICQAWKRFYALSASSLTNSGFNTTSTSNTTTKVSSCWKMSRRAWRVSRGAFGFKRCWHASNWTIFWKSRWLQCLLDYFSPIISGSHSF